MADPGGLDPRDSQDTRATSTPQGNSPVSLAASLSSISPMEIQSESENEESGHTSVDDSNAALSFGTESTETRIGKAKKIKWTKFWVPLKPKDKNSLYFKLTAHPDDVESIVTDLLNIYATEAKSAIMLILQLFVDLCGYKKLSMDKVYTFEKQNSKDIIDRMQSDFIETDLKQTGKFIFMKHSHFESSISYIITEFIKHLIFQSFQSTVLFDEILTSHLFEFLSCMCFCPLRNVRVIGVILACKFLTASIHLYKQFVEALKDENANTSEALLDKKTFIENYVDFLYRVFDKNCLIPDKKSYAIKVKCAQELYGWIKAFPEYFIIKQRCLGRLMKMVSDVNETVRTNTLTICEKLINTDSIKKVLAKRIELFLKSISMRVSDTSSKVAIQAINIFTTAVGHFPGNITNEYKLSIVYRMFEKNLAIAKAAGKFVATTLYHQNRNEELLLLSFVNVAFDCQDFAERLPYFLQSCVEFIPELRNWNVIVKVLLKEDADNGEARNGLLKIFNECVRYSLTGMFSVSRPDFQKGFKRRREDHMDLANELVPHFEDLVVKFQTDKTCLRLLTEMLTFIDYDYCRSENLAQHYDVIFPLLRELFQTSTDVILLENITSVFSSFHENLYHKQAKASILSGIKDYIKRLDDDLRQLSPNERNILLRLRETSLKISILFSKIDLTGFLKWEDIFHGWDNHLKALKYLIVCCKWHLIWSLRRFMQNASNGDRSNLLLYGNCKEFVYSCLEMLKGANGQSEFFLIFESFCDLYANFEMELRRKRQFSNFVIKIEDSSCIHALFNFVVRFVIDNRQIHLDQRQKYLGKIVDVMYLGVIPVEHFAKILKFYHSYCVEFGPIINSVLYHLNFDQPSLPFLIMHTLAELYQEVLAKYKSVNINSDESKQIAALAKKLSLVKEMKSSDGLKLVNMSIYFALGSKENYSFFYYARYFAAVLNEGAKSEAYHLFNETVPQESKNHKMILLFGGILKNHRK